MKVTRLFTGTDDQSHFEDLEVPFESREDFGLFTLPEPAKAVFFREIPPGYVYPWHNVVCREYVVMLDGEAEVVAGGSQTFTITPASGYKVGSIMLDGISVSSGGTTNQVLTYSLTNVQASHSLEAHFTS